MTFLYSNRKKKEFFTFLLSLISVFAFGQVVNIPDANFKAKLLEDNVAKDLQGDWITNIDSNGNSELEINEVLNISVLNVSSASIVSMEGINSFTNLLELECSFNELMSLDVQYLVNLQSLKCRSNELTSLNIQGLNDLEILQCDFNQLTNLDIPDAINLGHLQCNNNLLTSLDVLGLTNLEIFYCSDNLLTSLNVQGLNNLKALWFQNNSLTTINVQNLNNLEQIICHNNQLMSLNVQGLTNLNRLTCSGNQIESINIQGLYNLKYFHCSNNQITSLNLQGLNILELSCSSNQLTSLDIQQISSLEALDCNNNQITSLNFLNLSNLYDVRCNSNELTSLSFINLPNLYRIECQSNQLTSLLISGLYLDNMRNLNCSSNSLTSLNLQGFTGLWNLYCSSNNISALNLNDLASLERISCQDNQLISLDLQNSSELRELSCANNELVSLYLKNAAIEDSLDISNNPDLVYICADDSQIEDVQTIADDLEYTNCIVNSYCTFVPDDNYNTIQGVIILDNDINGCDSNDSNISRKIHITDGTDEGYIFSNETYTTYTEAGTYTLTPVLENAYFTVSPESAEIIFADDFNNITIQDFCITPNGEFNDLEITILPIDDARPGFDASYVLIYENKGTTTLSGDIILNYMDDVLDFVSSSETTSDQATGALTWNYSNLTPFESGSIEIVFNVNSPVETPPVEIDDILAFTTNIQSSATEETPNDNIGILNQTVVGSYDPNDKTCLEGAKIPPERVGDYLHYIIRFENTGTYAAENVVVRDVIDVTKFDIASLEITNSSHEMKTSIEGNVVEFIFEGINLPFEDDFNDGYLAFKIKTLSSLLIGDEVTNQANIFFDFNAPITTNEAISEIFLFTSNQDIKNNLAIDILPNPVRKVLYFNTDLNIEKVGIFDALGRLIQYENIKELELNISHLSNGIYFIKVFTEEGIATLKIIKE